MTTAAELEESVGDMLLSLKHEGVETTKILVLMSESNYLLVDDPEHIVDSKLCGIPIAFNNNIPIGVMCLAQYTKKNDFNPMNSHTSFEFKNEYSSFLKGFWKKIFNQKEK